ncbi:retrovirus-related pol polyprotein from transposon TNT 1-94 [Tanacetum coccineum]
MFDEYVPPPPCVNHLVPEVAAPVSTVSTCSPSSTSVDQDAPSPSTSQTLQASSSHVIAPDPYSLIEPKSYKEALTESFWIEAMQEELNEFERLAIWELVPRPDRVMIITLKWIYKVKLDELGGVLRNKARLVAR